MPEDEKMSNENEVSPAETVMERFKRDQFAAGAGIELVEVRPGYARSTMEVDDRHLNYVGTVQGGAMFTLAAFTFAAAAASHGSIAVGVNMNITCLRSVDSGTLIAEAKEVSRTRRLAHVDVKVTNERGTAIAKFQGTAYIKGQNPD